MPKPLKIAVYSGEIPSTTFIERLVEGLCSKGLLIFRFGLKKRKLDQLEHSFHYTYSNRLSKGLNFLKYSFLLLLFNVNDKRKLDNFIKAQLKNSFLLKVKYYPVLYHKPDIFHLQWAKGIADWIWVQDFGIKLAVSLRGAHINYSPIANLELAETYKRLFPKVDAFHAVSKAIAKEAAKYNATEEKIKVIYSGLDLKKLEFNSKSFNSNTSLNIISIGRDHWKKGYAYALDAMGLIDDQDISFNYTIVGVDNNEELLYKRSQLRCRDNINFVGHLCFSEVMQLVRDADVLVLSSVEEGIANVVLEAMALGTLVISTDCGGMNEVITDTKNGFLVPVRNSEALSDALKKVSVLSKDDYLELTQEARKTIEQQHSHTQMINQMNDLYHSVLKEALCE
ncbi:colanic acid/amylovoran biosynthesis glycosyltransferase [Winogradskyella wandonensis]|uniref:Colanic acid/amylovoran biosynthesis glycosyltransferase n=1 Tax=Winogradskyella wandonensis TaxID=1442586 RepID=A0A4R1KUK6_9FLAO|nr:glycosyltransferase family 4 protein [Winogradskyella wandonensis]TCK68834.1 colanic acid/amylovoran biosynthesis glycosyltransferase [Winogradskyella wandonensis]